MALKKQLGCPTPCMVPTSSSHHLFGPFSIHIHYNEGTQIPGEAVSMAQCMEG